MFPSGPPPYGYNANIIESVGDTIIQGKTCMLLEVSRLIGSFQPTCTYDSSGSIFMYNPDVEEFVKIYDFNAGVGDSWTINSEKHLIGLFDSLTFEISELFSITTNGELLPSQQVALYHQDNFLGFDTVIIGVGNIRNFLIEPYALNEAPFDRGLRCYVDADRNIKLVDYACDMFIPFTSTIDIDLYNTLELYPNPATDNLTFSYSSKSYSKLDFDIVSTQGKVEISGTARKKVPQTQNLDYLPAGQYYLVLKEWGKTLAAKPFILSR